MKTTKVEIVPVEELMREIRVMVEEAGNQFAVAGKMKVSDSSLSSVMSGRRLPPRAMLEILGLEVKRVMVKKS